MNKNEFYYLVSNERSIWADDDEADEPISSRYQETNVYDNNLLEARKKALEKAESLIRYFEEKPDELSYPTKKFNEIVDRQSDFWIIYQIRVFLMKGEEAFCIFDDGVGFVFEFEDYIYEEILKGLEKEFEIFKELNINTKQIEEKVTYLNDKTTKITKILPNGMDWRNVQINRTSESMDVSDITFDSSINKKAVRKEKNKQIKFKTSLKYQFESNHNNIEFSIKATSEIPIEIQKELSLIIEKWQKM